MSPLVVLGAATVLVFAFMWWLTNRVQEPHMSGDAWYMTQMAFTDGPVSAPYCWRPLVPYLARYLGFGFVSYTASLATVYVVYFYAGGGWKGCAIALMFVSNPHLFRFNVSRPQYAEGVGHLIFISSIWAMSVESPWAYLLFFLASLTRETITAALGTIALFVNPWLILPLAAGSAIAYFGRNENKENQHPLVEKTPYDTLVRWARVKESRAFHYAHTFQGIRGAILIVPFVWDSVSVFARFSLTGIIAIWLLALPASGQTRLFAYSFGLFIPFYAALPGEWLWFVAAITVFWPIDFNVYDETGGHTFGFAR